MKIAIIGKMRSGKSVACDYIKNKLNAEKFEFSDPVKEVSKIIFNDKVKNRENLVKIGQHMRKMDKNIWVNIIERRMNDHLDTNSIVVSSIRQQNEYDMLKKNGFIFIKIETLKSLRIERCLKNKDVDFEAQINSNLENDLDNFEYDYLIKNNGTLEEFYRQIDLILYKISQDSFAKAFKRRIGEGVNQKELEKRIIKFGLKEVL